MFRKIFFPLALMALAACQPSVAPPQPPIAATPAWHGTPKPVSTGVGILLGGWAGTGIIAKLDNDDRIKSQQAENRAYTASIGQKVTWNNPDTGNAGTLVPTRDGYDANGAYFREFQQTLTVAGAQYQGTDMASQQPDGTWKIVPSH